MAGRRNSLSTDDRCGEGQRHCPVRRQLPVMPAVGAYSHAPRLAEEAGVSGLPGYRQPARMRCAARSRRVAGTDAPRNTRSKTILQRIRGISLDGMANATHLDHRSLPAPARREMDREQGLSLGRPQQVSPGTLQGWRLHASEQKRKMSGFRGGVEYLKRGTFLLCSKDAACADMSISFATETTWTMSIW